MRKMGGPLPSTEKAEWIGLLTRSRCDQPIASRCGRWFLKPGHHVRREALHALQGFRGAVPNVDVHDEIVNPQFLVDLQAVDHFGGGADDDARAELFHRLVERKRLDPPELDDSRSR